MRIFGIVGSLVVALCVGYFVLHKSVTSIPGQGAPQQQIDVIAIRERLLAIGQAERQYLVAHNTYGTLEQLAQEDLLTGGTEQRGYTYSASVIASDHFTITATPTDASKAGWPTLEITEGMQVTQR